VVLAKELATLDALSGGRLIAGVGIGWNEVEFANIGMADRYHKRGAYLDETIRLWRHLWSGSSEPFAGAFHSFTDFTFEPLPARRDRVPIVVGGTSEAALRRAGTLGDGYQATRSDPAEMVRRIPVIREAAEAAGRPMPTLSARVRVMPARTPNSGYALSGDPPALQADVRTFASLGVDHLALAFEPSDPARLVAAIERFDREVVKAVGD
jgi:alkanesulfonate monooxygenase SsuD/methylene tetrahydromethanopterin reductase-like flavin-dependent oxidoreductase (luciferase family)